MKSIILTIPLMLIMSVCFGQKMLNEVKLRNSQIEAIDISSIADFETYQKERFNNSILLERGSFSKLYKLKGSDDFLILGAKTNKEFIENWDKKVLTTIEMYSHGINRNEIYIENIKTVDAKAVIFFVKDSKYGNKNYIEYQNKNKSITLGMTYISTLPEKERVENMRKIIKAMKFD